MRWKASRINEPPKCVAGRHGGICCTGIEMRSLSFEDKSGGAGRAAAGGCEKTIDGGMLSGYILICERHRRRVRSAKPKFCTSLPKKRRRLGFLGGSE